VTQNKSHAVMAQRFEAHDSLDFFPTPPWAARAFCKYVVPIFGLTVWEPACGNGSLVRGLLDYSNNVHATDIFPYGQPTEPHDFLWPTRPPQINGEVDWIITNPPFRLGEQFAAWGLQHARVGVALLVRTAFLEGTGRHARLFRPFPPAIIAQFTERVPMVKGRLDKGASTATAYCWIVWKHEAKRTEFYWIPQCRAQLEKPSDYSPLFSRSLPNLEVA